MTIGEKNIQIRDLMRAPVLVEEDETLKAVLERMVTEKRNSLTVVDKDGKLVGAVNAVDIIKEVIPDYLEEDAVAARFADDSLLKEDAKRVSGKCVREFMAREVPTVEDDTSLLEAAVMATLEGRGRITVVDKEKKPIGILTRTEIKQVIASYLEIPNVFSS